MQEVTNHTFLSIARRAKFPIKTAIQSDSAKMRRTEGLISLHSRRRQNVLVREQFKINTVISESYLINMLSRLKSQRRKVQMVLNVRCQNRVKNVQSRDL